jgi:hypothetical protein
MGLEASCSCSVDGETAEAKARLETRELILRAPFGRSFPIADKSSAMSDALSATRYAVR